jgi:hypothetical protein
MSIFPGDCRIRLNNQDALLKVNGKIQQSGRGENDFSEGIVYDLFVADKKQKSYRVTITKEGLSNNFLTFTSPASRWNNFSPPFTWKPGRFQMRMKSP